MRKDAVHGSWNIEWQGKEKTLKIRLKQRKKMMEHAFNGN